MASDTAPIADWQNGEVDPTRDGVRLRVDKVTDGLDRPTDAVFAPDGRLFIAERTGRVRSVADGILQSADALLLPEDDDGVPQAALSIAFDPDFANTIRLRSAHGGNAETARSFDSRATESSAASLPSAPCCFSPPLRARPIASAVARFGPDGKLYIVVSGGDLDGRLFRLNPDGTHAARSGRHDAGRRDRRDRRPRSRLGHRVRAFCGSSMTIRRRAHLSGVSMSSPPVRAIIRGRTTLRPGVASLAFYTGDAIPEMRNEALIVSAEAYLLRIAICRRRSDPGGSRGAAAAGSCRTAQSRDRRAGRRNLFLHRHVAREAVAGKPVRVGELASW